MSQVSRNTVKTWFETGDRPTQAQFYDWLESVVWYDEGGSTHPYKRVDVDGYVILSTDYVLSVNNGSNNVEIFLPDPATFEGKIYVIKRFDITSTGSIRIRHTALNSVQDKSDGSFGINWFLVEQWGNYLSQVTYQSNGVAWEVIG